MIVHFLAVPLLIVSLISVTIIFLCFFSIYTIINTKVPWAPTPKENIKLILEEFSLPKNSIIHDLGCGDGRFLFEAEKSGLTPTGFELSLSPYLKCLILKKMRKSKIIAKRKNFLNEDLSQADAVFVFLVSRVMHKVADKLKADLKPGTKVISYGFEIPGWELEKKLETKPSKTYIYIK